MVVKLSNSRSKGEAASPPKSLDPELEKHHCHCSPLVKVVTGQLRLKGGERDIASQWEKWQRICSRL